MRSVVVVVNPPFFDDLACLVVEVGEQVFVEALISQAAVEALDDTTMVLVTRRVQLPEI